MMEVYFEIQRIAALHHKILFEENAYSFFGSGSYLAQDYFLTKIAPYISEEIFGESYIGEELKKEIDNFVAQYHRGNKFIIDGLIITKDECSYDVQCCSQRSFSFPRVLLGNIMYYVITKVGREGGIRKPQILIT